MRKQRLVAALATCALGLSSVSCAGDQAEPAASDVDETATTDSSPSASSSSAAPSSAASESEPTSTLSVSELPSATVGASPSGTTRGGAGDGAGGADVAAMLLPATRMGKLNAEWTWSSGNDFDTEPANLTACHRVELEVIGAEDVAVREYTSRLDAAVRAYHLVASLPDDVTARRAYSVLQSWRDGCRQRLERRAQGEDDVHVSPAEPLRTAADSASSYVVFQPTATGSARIDNVASALDGSLVHLVVVRVEGNDFNYPRGATPAAVGVRNAVQRSG